MDIKIINGNPTNQVLVALMDYRIDYDSDEKKEKYGFGHFELSSYVISTLNHFHDNWENGKRSFEAVIIDLHDLRLITSDYIYNLTYELESENVKGIKLDSINFTESKPIIDYPHMINGKGYIIAYRHGFVVQCENLNNRYSSSIYRSILFSYWKINHLLMRKKPI